MKRRLLTLALVALTIGLLGSCSEINERIDKLESRLNGVENETIASINSQIGSINSSIADLSAIRTSIQSLTSTVEGQKSDLAALEAADEALGGRIDELTDFVNGELANYAKSDWVNATFSTLKQYEETCDTIAKIDARIGALDTKLSQDIANCKDTLTSWINAQFGSYYTIAEMDAMVGELKAMLDTAKAGTPGNIDSLAAELAATKAAIDTAKAQVTREYEAAIDTAITKLDGKLSKALQEKIDSVNTAIAALEDRVKTLELQVYILAGRITELEKRIQSVSIIPAYSDGRVEYDNDTLYIDCRINPATAVATLDKANFKVLLTKVLTKAVAIDTLPLDSIKVFTKDVNDGTISIQANIAKIIDALNENSESLAVAVNVNKGISNYTSNYLPLHIPVDSVVLAKDSIEIKVGKDTTLTATVYPANASNKSVIWTSTDDDIATVDQNGKITAIAAGTVKIAVTTVNKEMTDTCVVTVKPNLPAGALAGEFTVGKGPDNTAGTDDDVKVHFSKGNLRYVVNGTKWEFYEKQYDFCNTNIYVGHHADTISLFTWGYNGTKPIAPDGTECVTGHTTDGESFDPAEDWGTQIGDGNTWRTLSKDEWTYLFYTRTVNGGSGAGKSYSLNITYGGKMGVVLYPDGYSGSALTSGTDYTDDTFPAGCVFLPAAGHRNGSALEHVGVSGYYMSSTVCNVSNAYYVSFNSDSVNPNSYNLSTWGFSVRLITESK